MHYVYIIYAESADQFYKGTTSDLEKRLAEHNSGFSRYTRGKAPWKLVLSVPFNSKTEALIEERRLKRLNRRSLLKYIQDTGGS